MKANKQSKTKKSSPKNISQIRIIAGQYRRRNIGFVDADGLRPTPDRVRETIFNWLNDDLINARVLDCCAGSGAFGFESLSRGASEVVMIEPNRQQFEQLLITKQTLNINSQLNCQCGNAEQILPNLPKQTFDVVFLDPPYALNLWQDLLKILLDNQLIDKNSLIYIEANQEHQQILGEYNNNLNAFKYKKMGQIFAGVYQLMD